MKKVAAIWLALVLLLVTVVGCGNDQTSTQDETGAETETVESSGGDEAEAVDTTENSTEEVVEIRFMGYNSESARATYLKLLDEKFPNIDVVFEFVALDNFSNVLNAQLASGNGPDIIEVGGEAKLLANAGYLLDLTDQAFVDEYASSGLIPYTVDDSIYATPLQSWYEGIFYNKTIFEEQGIEVPKTLDAWIDVHKQLEAAGIKAQTMGAQSWEPMMKQSIGVVLNEFYSQESNSNFDTLLNKGEVVLDGNWNAPVKEWYQVIEEGCLTPDMLGYSYDQALDEFATGNAAMWESGPWAVNTIIEKNPDLEFGMFPIPGLSEGPGWLIGGPGSALAINSSSEYVDEALAILEFTATPEAQKALIKDNAGSSFVKGVEVDLGPIYDECQEAFKAGNVYAPWINWTSGNTAAQAYGKAMQDVLAGVITVDEAIKSTDEVIKEMREVLE